MDLFSGVLNESNVDAAKRDACYWNVVRAVRSHVMKQPKVGVKGRGGGVILGARYEAVPATSMKSMCFLPRDKARFCLNHFNSLQGVND